MTPTARSWPGRAEDLVEAGVPAELARRLTKLILRRADEADAPASARERAQAYLARLHQDRLEAQRLASEAAAIADRLAGCLHVSFTSDDFAAGQQARADLAVASALSRLAARTAAEACASVAGVELGPAGVARHEGLVTAISRRPRG